MKAGKSATIGGFTGIPELDGIRGLAILLVLLVHWFYRRTKSSLPEGISKSVFDATMASGWVGVELFFVLSGFLITAILLKILFIGQYSKSQNSLNSPKASFLFLPFLQCL